jgi:rfaE bifunctional protein nucleotidyltransferase chain/domain
VKHPLSFFDKIVTAQQAQQLVQRWRLFGQTTVFTNGVFDLLHEGHLFSLSEAAKEGDHLIIGLNADASVKKLKGPNRPIQSESSRSKLLAALPFVDAVVLFESDTPAELIERIEPDVLVKGGDYTPEQIAGAESVLKRGGRIVINPILEGFSTTALIQKMQRPEAEGSS